MVLVRNAEGISGGGIPRASSKADKLHQICSEWDSPIQESIQTKLMKRRATKEQSRVSKSVNSRSKSYGSGVLRSIWRLLYSVLRWLAVLIIAVLLLSATVQNEKKETGNILEPEQHTWQLLLFRLLPARFLSRLWGFTMSIEVPEAVRTLVYSSFVWKYSCNMTEAEVESLRHYTSLGTLFTRKLKKIARTISESKLVSPTDGKILHFGTVQNGLIEQVKGVTYSLETFLGPEDLIMAPYLENSSKSNNTLYHVVIYLGPGDYHHFHSPTNWTIYKRRHFPGDLLTVAPWAARTIPGLFSINERVILHGSWKYGFFSMTAVGAYNVGSIDLAIDETLETNAEDDQLPLGEYRDKELGVATEGLEVKKGDRLGGFKLGSTIVLVFRAPSNFQFSVSSGQTVQYGQSLGTIHSDSSAAYFSV